MTVVQLVPTGVANTASVQAAFARLAVSTAFVGAPETIASAPFVVLPGVGAFDAAMQQLDAAGYIEPLRERIAAGRPTLAICLGMHLLGTASEEAVGATGLEVAGVAAGRFGVGARVPHMGWSAVTADTDCKILGSGAAYFAHSYRWVGRPAGFAAAAADHDGQFVAAVERGPVVACQFHPELSGDYGAGLLKRWLCSGGVSW